MTTDATPINFKLLAGQPSLDFVNTVGGWVIERGGGSKSAYTVAIIRCQLSNYADLLRWCRHAGLISDREAKQLSGASKRQPKAADAVHKRGIKLRESLFRLFRATLEGSRPDAAHLKFLNDELRIARSHQSLGSSGSKLEWTWDDNEALDRVIWPLALSGAELLSAGDLSRLRQCGGEECGWMFLDTSRNRSRQWCAMNDCGNLAKVRRFRQRQARSN